MLTPQEIQEKKFSKAVLGGYDMAQIDSFLDAVFSDYTALYKENATLKGKMRVLVDKIEEYRSVDEQMRKAFYSAQIAAQEIVAKAEAEAEAILRNAKGDAEKGINDIRVQTMAEEARLVKAKAETNAFADRIAAVLKENYILIEKLLSEPAGAAELAVPPAKARMEDFTLDFSVDEEFLKAEEIAADQTRELAGISAAEHEAEPAGMVTEHYQLNLGADGVRLERENGEAVPDMDDSTKFNFTEIRFGKNYSHDDEDQN